MQPTLCSKCRKNVAVVFITRMDGTNSVNEGLCLTCARKLGIQPVNDMMSKLGLSDEDIEGLSSEMMNAFGGPEGLEALTEAMGGGDDNDEEDEGKTATFPFLNKLFNHNAPFGRDNAAPSDNKDSQNAPRREDKAPKQGGKKKNKFIDNYCVSLTGKAREGKLDNIVGRKEEIARVIQILNRRQKNNPCLIGEPGVGKTAIAEGLAQKIVAGEVPYKLADKEVYLLDLTALVAAPSSVVSLRAA